MVINLTPPLDTAVRQQAQKRGVPPETLALDALRERFLLFPPIQPQDEWERKLFSAEIDCGTAVPDSALSSEALYD